MIFVNLYCIVSPFSNSTFDEIGLTYFIPDFLLEKIKIGQIIKIPLKTNIENAIVLEIIDENSLNIDKNKIKSIIDISLDGEIILKNHKIELLKWIAKNYFSQIHNCVNLFLPKKIREKIEKDKIEFKTKNNYKYNYNYKKTLSGRQKEVYDKILNSEKKVLLYGITGSGKTEIYINLIKKYLDQDKQILFLIPEIILTNQIGDKIKDIFGDDVIIINSNITETNKYKYFIDIMQNKAKIIVGTRSSLFYPFYDLGLIIVDEEHDNSYNSDKNPKYNSIEVIEKLNELLKIKIVLGSGTPSVKTMYKAINKNYEIVNLFELY